jgi:hypothetical protein|tara:strand:- start:69 stop:1004 length:936 start_codon:yes stop_codon:yes gene_type:complete
MVVDRINEMKSQGLPTGQIVQNLKQEGISPKEINEALTQSQLPNQQPTQQQNMQAQNNQIPGNPMQPNPMNPQIADPTTQMQQSQLSVSQQSNEPTSYQSPNQQSPQPTNQMQQTDPTPQMQQSTTIQPTNNLMPQSMEYQGQPPTNQPADPYYQDYQQGYDEYPEYSPQQGIDVETINDLATQIIEDKIQDLREGIIGFTKFKKQIEDQTIEMEKRLAQIELTMNDLQMAIIKKVGEYGENIQNISKELKSTQNSFSKLANPIMDKRDLTKTASEIPQNKTNNDSKTQDSKKTEKKSNSKKSNSFEDYLR